MDNSVHPHKHTHRVRNADTPGERNKNVWAYSFSLLKVDKCASQCPVPILDTWTLLGYPKTRFPSIPKCVLLPLNLSAPILCGTLNECISFSFLAALSTMALTPQLPHPERPHAIPLYQSSLISCCSGCCSSLGPLESDFKKLRQGRSTPTHTPQTLPSTS